MSLDLFPDITAHLRELYGLPEGWMGYAFEVIPPEMSQRTRAMRITGMVPGVYKRGPKRGQPNFRTGDKATRATYTLPMAQHATWLQSHPEFASKRR